MDTYKHRKTGALYTLLAYPAQMEADGLSGPEYVVYQSQENELVWVRPASEFFDGRFELGPSDKGEVK